MPGSERHVGFVSLRWLAFAMKTSCRACDVPSGRVVSMCVRDHSLMINVDFAWRVGPCCRFSCQLVYLNDRVRFGLRRLSHQQ